MIRLVLAVGVSVLLVTASCTSEDIVLASSVTDGGATTTTANGLRCLGLPDECGDGAFCSKHYCAAAAGVCERISADGCNSDEHPVCGCDGITYFNDCERKYNLQAAAQIGACDANAEVCGGAEDPPCPAGTFCAFLNEHDSVDRDACRAPTRGHCWVVPQQCPSDAHSDQWHECEQGQESRTCVSTCVAAKSQKPYVRATASTPCQ